MNLKEEFGRDELKRMDVKHLRWWNIFPLSWDWSRGAKTVRYYTVGSGTNVTDRRAKVEWSYIMDTGNRNVVTPTRMLNFLEEDGVTPFLSQDISKPFNVKELGELNQVIRNGRITDLTANAAAVSGGQAIVDALYAWYGTEIAHYISPEGSLEFEDALKAETDPTRLATLNAPIPEFGNASVMQLLSFQLVGTYDWS